jgi:hypothetical protein
MKTLTMQQYFTETVTYLRTQQRCVGDSGACTYLNASGNRCAVGYWLPDGHEALSRLGGIRMLADDYPDLAGVAWPDTERGVDLAYKLQDLHDDEGNRGRGRPNLGLSPLGERRARGIARRFGLAMEAAVEA